MKVFTSPDDFVAAVGSDLGPGPWRTVEQSRVDAFAVATDDEQWIHVDAARAAAGPFGGTIAHGFLTLSLLPSLMRELYAVEGARMGVNYGLNKVRFPAALPVGSRVRMRAKVVGVEEIQGGAQFTLELTFEHEGGDKPVCVAESVARVYVG